MAVQSARLPGCNRRYRSGRCCSRLWWNQTCACNADGDEGSHHNEDTNGHPRPHSYVNTNNHAYRHTNRYADGDCHPHRYSYADGHSHTYTNLDAH
jgi:hypothetical protein